MSAIRAFIGAHRRGVAAAGVIVAVPVLALAWWLGSPLFIDRAVDEEFPFSANAVAPEGMTQRQIEETMATMAMMDTEVVAEAMPSMTPDEMMAAAVGEMASEMIAEMTPEMMAGMMTGAMPEGMAEEATAGIVESMAGMLASGGPAAVKRGMFRDADGFHKGEGSATVYRLPDGSHVLRFEDFRVTNGPDLRVLLVKHSDPRGRSDVSDAGYIELAKLKGNVGNQNYELPEGVSPGDYGSVVIYCKPFQVVFSVAPLSET